MYDIYCGVQIINDKYYILLFSVFKCGHTELRKPSTCDTSDCTRPQTDESFISITSDESFIAVMPW